MLRKAEELTPACHSAHRSSCIPARNSNQRKLSKLKFVLFSAKLVYDLCVCPPPLGSPGEARAGVTVRNIAQSPYEEIKT
jgi:hypothetical protein